MKPFFLQVPSATETIGTASNWASKAIDLGIEFAPKILLAILTVVIGNWVIGLLVKGMKHAMQGRSLDVSLQSFLESLISVGLRVIVFIMAAGVLGFQTTSLVAILGAASLAVGLALQGSLSNFAGGVLILIFKPYKIGDLIKAQGEVGNVTEIQIFNTIILTPDNRTVILPNGLVSNGVITNMTKEIMRVDIEVQAAYGADISKIKEEMARFFATQSNVIKSPAPSVEILKFNDTTLTIAVRPYATANDYWDVYFAANAHLKKLMDTGILTLPQPSIVVKQS